MYYDILSEERQEEIKDGLVNAKNREKDPAFTKKFLELTLKHFAVFTPDGEYRRLTSHTKESEHSEIRKILKSTKATNTLEVGFAYGTSALVFAEHHQRMENTGIRHTILDPNQNDQWESIGVENLKRCGVIKGKNYRLIEETSILALPELLKKNKRGWLDVALIDGWHLFDYTLMDIFYCIEMLRVGGVLIVDDKRMKAIRAVSNYVKRAYPHIVNICESCPTILVLKKKAEDTRDWNADEKLNFNLS